MRYEIQEIGQMSPFFSLIVMCSLMKKFEFISQEMPINLGCINNMNTNAGINKYQIALQNSYSINIY